MENTTKINRCLEEDMFCNQAVDYCAVRRYYEKVQKKLENHFFTISLKRNLRIKGR